MMALKNLLRGSVRGRLALLVVVITAPAALLVAVLVVQAYHAERASVGEHLLGTSRAFAAALDQQMSTAEALLKGLAASRDLDTGNFAAFDQRVRATVAAPDRWVVLADPTGKQLVNTRTEVGTSLPRQELSPEFDAAMRAGRTFVSNLTMRGFSQRHAVFVAVPVIRDGQLKYTLTYVLLPSALAENLRIAAVSSGVVVAVIDRVGTIAARHPNGDRFVGSKAMPDIVAATRAGFEGVQESVTLEGVDVLAAHTRGPVSGWSIAMGAPKSAMYASARRLLWSGLVASTALMTIAILMAIWIGRALVRSVDTLVADTEVIGRGDVPAERSSGLAETDFVGDAMRKTALRLRDRERENHKLNVIWRGELEKVKRAEEASRRLGAIVECSDDAIVSKNLEGIVTSWNHGAERVFGYTAQEMVGRSIAVLLPPDCASEEASILDRVRRGERVNHFETTRRRKDGALIPISLSVSPLRDHAGNVVGASKIARDITQRVRSESQQHALYELVATVNRAEALPQIYEGALTAISRCQDADRAAILLFDASGVMRFAAARGLSETYQAAVEGHSPWPAGALDPQPVWIDDVVQAELKPELRRALVRENIRALAFLPLTYEKRLLGKFMLYYNAPHRFSASELRPVETIASQVAFAIERQKGAEALEALVDERTLSLRQVVAQMEEFSYSVSHDLRAPVRAMRGFAEIVLQDNGAQLDEQGRELLGRILRNSARMDRLIQDLLTYSRISRREIQLEPVSLDKLVREVLEEYPDMRPERADIEVNGPLPDVMAHEPSLTQVVSNLLSNAVKFVPPQARPRVRVSFDRDAARARLWFEDNGIGIKPEHQKRLFGMFERVHPDKLYEGTGIGLAIVRKAVERMNGAVGVESDGVSGSKFWFELPIASK